MKRKIFLLLFILLSCLGVTFAETPPVEDLIVMTEKVKNPSGQHGDPTKQPATPIEIYQTDNVFFFGESFVGCAVSLLLNDVVMFSTEVDENGLVTIPETFIGTYELQLVVGDVVYWAMVEL